MSILTSRIDSQITRWLRVSWLGTDANFEEYSPAQFYAMQNMYYQNNGLYQWLMYNLYNEGIHYEGMMPLRNPAFRVVEFYVNKIWAGVLPDALAIDTKNNRIIEPIHQIWLWSNWNSEKQVAARTVSKHGDWFCKVATRNSKKVDEEAPNKFDRVYFQNIYPGNVTAFDVDERGIIVWVRIDTVGQQRNNKTGQLEHYNITEVWDKGTQIMRQWRHEFDANTGLDKLGNPEIEKDFAQFGIDFIPIVHAKFRDIGEKRGMGAFDHALDKIDEANRQATRLHQMLFRHNKNTWVVENPGVDTMGRPLPPPKVGSQNTASGTKYDNQSVIVGDEEFFTLPGTAQMKSLVPSIDYKGALDILNAQMQELENDMPELAYYRLREMNQVSGIAAQHLLGDAIDRVLEARGNVEIALARLNAMALTIAAKGKLFTDYGTYEKGDFEHTFEERAVIPLSQVDRATIIKGYVDAGVPLVIAAERAGFSKDDIEEMLAAKDEQSQRAQTNLAQALLANERGSRQGDNPDNNQPGDNDQPAPGDDDTEE